MNRRMAVAVIIGIAFGALGLFVRLSGLSPFSDFDQIWIATRALVSGVDPYQAVAAGFHWPLYYPLPAAIVGLPFAAFPIEWAGPLFTAVGFTLLAYALTERAWWPLIALASYPAVDAAQFGQWSPILTAAALLPALGWLIVAKPTTGVVTIGAFGTTRIAGAIALILFSLALWPPWIGEWLSAVRGAHHFAPLVTHPLGLVLLLSLLRWRRPEARLLALLAVLPQAGAPYDALPLVLICSNKAEAFGFAVLSLAAVPFLTDRVGTGAGYLAAVDHNATVLLVTLYLPALAAVLRRPNHVVRYVYIDDRSVLPSLNGKITTSET